MYGKIRIIEKWDNMKKVMRNRLEKSRIQEFAFIIIEIFSLLRSFKKLIPMFRWIEIIFFTDK